MAELKVRYGVPQPTDRIDTPQFKAEGKTTLRLSDFPNNVLPSGGLSNRISESEMYMVQTCRPTTMTWKDSSGKVLSRAQNAMYSFIGHFPWEITLPGLYMCEVEYNGAYKGRVEFEVV